MTPSLNSEKVVRSRSVPPQDLLSCSMQDAPSSDHFPKNLPPGWKDRLSSYIKHHEFIKLVNFLKKEAADQQIVYPPRPWILRALQYVDYDAVKVVILGQDPYHGQGQALGLSFGVPNRLQPKPPSLQNILKELKTDLGVSPPANQSDLTGWAAQGVLLLNTVLTVRHGQAFSHRDQGWEAFTDLVIQELNHRTKPVLFILWGAPAQRKKALITGKHHRFLEAPHPSPLSAYRGFFGSRPFSRANTILVEEFGLSPIDWGRISIPQSP